MTKAFKLNWHIEVPRELQEGSLVDRWTEDGDFEPDCTVKVDDCGFFIYWKSEARVCTVKHLYTLLLSDLHSSSGIDWGRLR